MADGRCTAQALDGVDKVGPDHSGVDQKLLAGAQAVSVGGQVAEIAVKKKRGRPPKNPAAAKSNGSGGASNNKRNKKKEEDVCFICFDGGNLVLCDHRDCPKAYHPACIKRDEAFFRRNIRWNCGWHLCNSCQRNALFMCYTCPYSLCKGCVKQADILCVRGNKGFCRTCMTTIMLIEKIPQENKELVQVDFDDTTNWEYLFKVYWVFLKQKESFTIDELTRATNPWKGSGLEHKGRFSQRTLNASVSKVSELSSSNVCVETDASKRRKTRKQALINISLQKADKTNRERVPCALGAADWASKELLEFVTYMKNGDTSALSQFDVQALLLEYIRMNNLRDPHRKCQVICDWRLESLFGKACVGHFEMLKLLEYHFKGASLTNGLIRGAANSSIAGPGDSDGAAGNTQTLSREMRRLACRKVDEKGRQNNLDSYAAINVHNINLIYLKRSLLEKLMVDPESFNEKVVGSVVRIRISSNDRKQDMHRLVRIIGTSKASEHCENGDRTQNIMLRILNLNKIEDIKIDAISDQEFSEDECRRLRQSIKLGLVERMTVGEIQEKAMALLSVRIDDWLHTEILKLSHLRDRASEMGHRKELRDLVARIELLKSPEARKRRINEVPEVHADARMDPSYGSDDDSGESDAKRRDGPVIPKYSNLKPKAMELISPARVGEKSKDNRAQIMEISAVNGNHKRKLSTKYHLQKMEGAASKELEALSNPSDSAIRTDDSRAMSQAVPSAASTLSNGMLLISDFSELEKIWQYRDPAGKVQGPFCLLQLHKWNSNGFFPTDLRVWKMGETQDQSVLLNDALRKQHPIDPDSRQCATGLGCTPDGGNSSDLPTGSASSVAEEHSMCGRHSQQLTNDEKVSNQSSGEITISTGRTAIDNGEGNKPSGEGNDSSLPDSAAASNTKNESMSGCNSHQAINDESGFGESSGPNVITNPVENPSANGAANSAVAVAKNSPKKVDVNSTTDFADQHSDKAKFDHVGIENQAIRNISASLDTAELDSASGCAMTANVTEVSRFAMTANVTEVSDPWNKLSKSELEDLKGPNMESNHPVTSKSDKVVVFDMPAAALKPDDLNLETSAAETEHSVAEHTPGQDSHTSWGAMSRDIKFTDPNASQKLNDEALRNQVLYNNHSATPNIPGQDNNWSTTSSLVVGEVHLSDVSCELTHCAPANSDCYTSGWQPIELSTLGDDMVSDLLSEVEAMESLRGMSSPNSRMDCGDDSVGSPRDHCFSLEGLNLNLDLGHNDALNSADMQFHVHHHTTANQQQGSFPFHVLTSSGHDVKLEVKPACSLLPDQSFASAALSSASTDRSQGSFSLDVHKLSSISCTLASPSPKAKGEVKATIFSMPLLDSTSKPQEQSTVDINGLPSSISTETDSSFKMDGKRKESSICDHSDSSPKVYREVKESISEPPPCTLIDSEQQQCRVDVNDLSIGASGQTDRSSQVDEVKANIASAPLQSSTSVPLLPAPIQQWQGRPRIDVGFPSSSSVHTTMSPKMKRGINAVAVSMPQTSISEPPQPTLPPQLPPPPPILPPPQPPSPPPPPPKPQPPCSTGLDRLSSPQEEGEMGSTSVSVPETTPQDHQPSPKTAKTKMATAETRKQVSETSREPPWQENGKFSNSGSILGSPNMHRSTPGSRVSQTSPRYSHSRARHFGPKDRSHHHYSVDSGFGRSKSNSWSRQSSFGGEVGGSLRAPHSHSHSHRGQRVCKFYESGFCKKGASCKYLHP